MLEYHNKEKYEGDWENDMKNGFGKHYYTDGSYYEGNFQNGKRNGEGIFHYD